MLGPASMAHPRMGFAPLPAGISWLRACLDQRCRLCDAWHALYGPERGGRMTQDPGPVPGRSDEKHTVAPEVSALANQPVQHPGPAEQTASQAPRAGQPTRTTTGASAPGWRAILGAVLALVAVVVFIDNTANHGFSFFNLLTTIGGIAAAGWLLTGAVAGIAALVSAWLAVAICWLALGITAFVDLISLVFGIMVSPVKFFFINAPTAPLEGGCTSSTLGWALTGFQPSECSRIALGRLGLAAVCLLTLVVMGKMAEATKSKTKKAHGGRGAGAR